MSINHNVAWLKFLCRDAASSELFLDLVHRVGLLMMKILHDVSDVLFSHDACASIPDICCHCDVMHMSMLFGKKHVCSSILPESFQDKAEKLCLCFSVIISPAYLESIFALGFRLLGQACVYGFW